jgi:predicted N-acetyltransferase YhbS
MTVAAPPVQQVDRRAMQRWLPCLDAWLLPDAAWGVQHTWPQLYRSDGDGRFFVVADGDALLSHCAVRLATLRTTNGAERVALLGSVCTAPSRRGEGLASAVLAAAVHAAGADARHCVLWATEPGLYTRAGFVAGAPETCLLLGRRPHTRGDGVRAATVADHGTLHALHARNPLRVERTPAATSRLLTTPGVTTLVLETDGQVVAYACCGKGADLRGHWHELGGADGDVARLLPAALHVAGQTHAAVLVPPYRTRLRDLLGAAVVDTTTVPGPMVRTTGGEPLGASWIDGLDSV